MPHPDNPGVNMDSVRAAALKIAEHVRARAAGPTTYEGMVKDEIAAARDAPGHPAPIEIMRCGHRVVRRDARCSCGRVFVQFTCERGCRTVWAAVGDEPAAITLPGATAEHGCHLTDQAAAAFERGGEIPDTATGCPGECAGCSNHYLRNGRGF